jgi:O-acetyl-ADP-ribose deacetylase (regulator of RNase III)
MRWNLGKVVVECVQGDITQQPEVDAIVNAANAELSPGGGVSGAIHRAAGPLLAQESMRLGPLHPGQAVLTQGYRLPNRWVIHCLGPVYGHDKPEDQLLSSCYQNALKLAEEKGLESVAFPAISTGIFGYPVREAAQVVARTFQSLAPRLKTVKHIRMVLFGKSDLDIHVEEFNRYFC